MARSEINKAAVDYLHSIDLLYVLCGFAVGALIGVTGVGGGALMTPILIMLGINPATAVGTDLFFASLTKTAGTLVHGYNHTVDWIVVIRLATGSVLASVLTLFTLYELHFDSHTAQILMTRVLGTALLLTALSLLFHKRMMRLYLKGVHKPNPELVRRLTIAAGALVGVLVTISSVGAGAIGVTLLLMLYPHMKMKRIVGSDIAHSVPLTLAAGFGHWALGSIDWLLLASLMAGSLPGIFVGSYLAVHVPETVIRVLMAGTLLVVCGKMLFY